MGGVGGFDFILVFVEGLALIVVEIVVDFVVEHVMRVDEDVCDLGVDGLLG